MALSRQLQRRLAYGGNAMLVTAMVIALVVLLYGIADRNRIRYDVSAEGDNLLQADTLKKLSLLDREGQTVQVTAFTAQEGKKDSYFKNRALKDLMLELDYHSTAVETRFVDFDRERLTAESLGVTEYGHLVVQRGEERVDIKARELFRNTGKGADRKLEFLGEAAFNRAASQILSTRRQTIYALRGHGELDPEEAGPDGLSEVAELLDQENYELKPLDLFRDREADEAPVIPADAAAVLLARPKAALTQPEEDALVAYVANGGSVLVALDPRSPVPWLLDRLDVTLPEGVVMDRLRVFPYDDRPVPSYGRHSTVDDLREQHIVTVVAHAAAVRTPEPAPEWMKVTSVLRTTRDGWIDRGGELESGSAVYQPEIDLAGPVDMAVALELRPEEGSLVNVGKRVSRVMVVGDADWFTNQLLAEGPGNASFAVNTFRWLLWDDARLSMIGRPTRVHRLALTEEDQGRIRWLVIGLMPMLSVLLGGAVWASRRGR
ncbi:MAG: Gldg family protein [Alphaproteobacteria bacterium]|nr:Gldg family protein [Alphaproteobacteria bacterium]